MNLTIERAPALAALQRVTGVVERRHTIEILANLVLIADADSLSIRGTDLDMEMVDTIPAKVVQPGAITLPADKLMDIVRNSDVGADISLDLNTATNRCIVKSGRSRFTVPGLPAGDFPEFPHEGFDGEFVMPAKTLTDMLSRVTFLVGRNDGDKDKVTSCVYLGPHGDQLHAVGACGLGVALRREPKPEGANVKALLKMKLVNQITKWLGEVDGEVKLAWVGYGSDRIDKLLRLQHGSTVLTSKLFDAPAYVPYMGALVEEREAFAKTDQDALAAALRRVQIMQDAKSHAIRLAFSDGGLVVKASNMNAGEGEDEIAADYEGAAVDFQLGSQPLSEAIGALRGDSVEVGFRLVDDEKDQDASKVVIRAPADNSFVAMLMKRRA